MNMTKLLVMLFTMTLLGTGSAWGQSRERKNDLSDKPSKEARKQAKELRKEGWKVPGGALSLERQLDRVYSMGDDNVVGTAKSTSDTYDAARAMAVELARVDLVSKIETRITGKSSTGTTVRAGSGNADSKTVVTRESKSFFTNRLRDVKVVYEAYHTKDNGNVEVEVRVMVKQSELDEIADSYIRSQRDRK